MNFKAISTISILALSIFAQNALAAETLLSCKATIADEEHPAQVIMMRVKKDGQKVILSSEGQGDGGKATNHGAAEQNYKIRSGLADHMKNLIKTESNGDDLNAGESAIGLAMVMALVAPQNKFSVNFDLSKVDHVTVYEETTESVFDAISPVKNSVVSAYSADGKLLGSFPAGFVGSLIQGPADCQNGDQSFNK